MVFRISKIHTNADFTFSNNNNSLFSARNIDMPRTVRMCPRKNKSQALKVDKECRKGRTYDIFAFQYGKKI